MAATEKQFFGKNLFRVILLIIASGAVSSCFFVEIRGPVVAAVVSVADWNYRSREKERLGFTGKTLGPAQLERKLGSAIWESWPARIKLIFMGVAEVPDDMLISPVKLYVLGSGPTCMESECLIKGADYDPYGNQKLSDTPLTVEGSLFAFANGEQINNQSVRISVLTTALYHYAMNFVSDKFIMDELDAIAPKLVTDINKDGEVDYSDALKWSRQHNEKDYLGDIRNVDKFADKIRDRDTYYFQSSWVDIVGSEGARMILGQDYVSSADGFDGYRIADGELYGTDGVPSPQSHEKALWLGERSTDQKIYSIEWWGYYKLEDLPVDTESLLFQLGLYTAHDSGVPGSRILLKKVKANVAPNPSYPYQELRITSEYKDYNGRLVYRYNAILNEPLLIPRDTRWLSIAQIDTESSESNTDFVLLASREGDAKVSFYTQYGWITPSYDRPRRSPLKGYIRLTGTDVK